MKEMINVAGIKFSQDIESILTTHDAVEEAVVFAMPNKRFGEVPHARIKLRRRQLQPKRSLELRQRSVAGIQIAARFGVCRFDCQNG